MPDMKQQMIEVRREYIDHIRKELLGPGSEISIPDAEHELISSSPDQRYSIGILYPPETKMKADTNDTEREVPDGMNNSEDEDMAVVEEESREGNSFSGEDYASSAIPPIGDSGDNGNLDEEIGMATQYMPSSMGLTFFAEGKVEEIHCRVEFATYRKATIQDCKFPFTPEGDPEQYEVPTQVKHMVKYDPETSCLHLVSDLLKRKEIHALRDVSLPGFYDVGLNAIYKLCDQRDKGYVRVPHKAEIAISFNGSDYADCNQNICDTGAKITALRRKVKDAYSVTVMLVNDSKEKDNPLFQPRLTILSSENSFVFREYSKMNTVSTLDFEEQSLEMQYRNKKVYATGLGTSTDWDIDATGHGYICTEFFPMTEVPSVDFKLPKSSDVPLCTLDMKYLSDLDNTAKATKITNLKAFIATYEKWIRQLEEQVTSLDEIYRAVGSKNIVGCRESYERMKAGLSILSTNNQAWDAFQLANRAMFMQRIQLKFQRITSDVERYPEDDDDRFLDLLESIDYNNADQQTDLADVYAWRPFQLAFLLMSVNSATDPKSADRDVVDLIWFPTGGGKTEAYLGLTAFTIFYRRLAHLDESDGTTVMMRYTLRLLAAQQFTRAATLICACEFIRRDCLSRRPKYRKYALGNSEITIGLWIGGEHTPNLNTTGEKSAEKLLLALNKADKSDLQYVKDSKNKFQVLKCPWCGTKMVKDIKNGRVVGTFGYRMSNGSHFEMYCPQESCAFNRFGKLPIQVVDEELYRKPPTLLFGTVDKFAMLPWNKGTKAFFALDAMNRSPELIIQDELHLISGPLGTMVGLYESAIDWLCSRKGNRPKIIASTATIRRAKEQCSALYDREVRQFPHPGLDAEDSFFARDAVIDHEKGAYGRTYVGLMPSGKTKAMMEVRSIAALMQRIHMMPLEDKIKDKYWTLTTYFNSLKDLGKCATLINDDVKDFVRRTALRLGTANSIRPFGQPDELTSRVTTTALNVTLDKLEKTEYSKANVDNHRYASSVVIATNMISVGIDIARLNVMLMVGQPKLTSEYIQASSRVGRNYPGVAFAMYDGSKSRDRSHYEQFKTYHESFYKHVEPTGATPFSKPARDRALHAVSIAMLRLSEPTLNDGDAAKNFERDIYASGIEEIRNFLVARSKSISNRIDPSMEDESSSIAAEVDAVFEDWERMAKESPARFNYGDRYIGGSRPEGDDRRLLRAYKDDAYEESKETMTSLRNVDTAVRGNILIWREEA